MLPRLSGAAAVLALATLAVLAAGGAWPAGAQTTIPNNPNPPGTPQTVLNDPNATGEPTAAIPQQVDATAAPTATPAPAPAPAATPVAGAPAEPLARTGRPSATVAGLGASVVLLGLLAVAAARLVPQPVLFETVRPRG